MSISKSLRTLGVLIACALTMLRAQPPAPYHKLSKKQLKILIASAKTPAQHRAIATYYHMQAQHFWAKYRREESDLADYDRHPLRYSSKYPTEGDRDRTLAGYDELTAEQADALADWQEKLAQKAK